MREEGFASSDIHLEREVDLHYTGQLWSIRVPIATSQTDAAALRTGFEAEYTRLYGHTQPDGTIMTASVRVTARATTGQIRTAQGTPGGAPPRPIERRDVWHPDAGWLASDIYAGTDLLVGHSICGPALIEELTTTVLLGPNDHLCVDAIGNFLVEVRGGTTHTVTGHSAPPTARDPIILALMQNRLDQISRHMGWVMTRTARSPIFSQSHDFSCFITDPQGTLIANADGIPIHTGGGGFAARAILKVYEHRINADDVFILSDPYEAGGNHLPDWVIARPIFVDHEGTAALAGFCCNRAHQSDIGGGVAGTYNPEATDIWQEGIRLPVCKLVDRGELRDDLWRLLLLNSRTPDLLDGDLRAMLGSTQIGGERVSGLAHELGVNAYFEHLRGVLDHADQRMREAISLLPDGVYFGEDHTDNDCFEKMDIAVRVRLTVEGDSLTVDFTQSDPQIKGFKNSSIANTYSSVFMALSSFFDTDIPRNEGTYRCVTVIAPQGSIVNPRPPAPMTMNTVFVAHEIIHATWKALATAAPDRALAGWAKTVHNHVAGVADDGRAWVMYQWHAMAAPGATKERDGFAQLGHLISLGGLDLPNLEFHEQMYPVRYRRWEFRTDAGGPGARRGGAGVHYEADLLAPALWSFRAEGLDTPSGYGVLEGGVGAVGEVRIEPTCEHADGPPFVPPKYGVRHLQAARMIASTPGGGGWGHPFDRPPEAVLRDVRDEIVSPAAARAVYGVALDRDERTLDEAETQRLRKQRE